MEAMIVKKMNELSAEMEMYEFSCSINDFYQQEADFIWSKELKREIIRLGRKS